jgi:hypothetical protein
MKNKPFSGFSQSNKSTKPKTYRRYNERIKQQRPISGFSQSNKSTKPKTYRRYNERIKQQRPISQGEKNHHKGRESNLISDRKQ